jgi:hypothetical protein
MSDDLAKSVLDCVAGWAGRTAGEIGVAGAYAFGSLVYRNGAQFVGTSDVDLVCIIPHDLDNAARRAHWIELLREHKLQIESELATKLNRATNVPICSIIAPTLAEVLANIHKDGAPGFFSNNEFLDLLSGDKCDKLPGAGTRPVSNRLTGECFRFSQKKRNTFLAVAAGGEGSLHEYSGDDPLPKDVMRHGAMAQQLAEGRGAQGEEYDTQQGLDFITHRLYEMRRDAPYKALHNKVSVRRGARGQNVELSPNDQIVLSEVIFDVAAESWEKERAKKENELPSMHGLSSTAEFWQRFAGAFPGVRGIEWFNEQNHVSARLKILLEKPLRYKDGTPVWWWRNGNNSITSFEIREDGTYLFDVTEYQISRIAAVNPGPYKYCFVYVECNAMPPIGLYDTTAARIAEVERGEHYWSYCWEEYGLLDKTRFIKREEYDDGATVIDGVPVDNEGRAELRVRYVTPYNFIIAAHGSPINNQDFDQHLEQILDEMLHGADRLPHLMDAVMRLPSRAW